MRSIDAAQAPAEKRVRHGTRPWVFWTAAAVVVVLDQLTKAAIRAVMDRGEFWPSEDWPLRLHYVTNTGAAFGILENQTVFLVLMTLIGLAAIYLYYRNPPFDHFLAPLAIGMMLGGAAGNLIDRVRAGWVTDFIEVPMWPAFNVADSSITIGVTVMVLGYLFLAGRTKAAASDDA